MLMVMEMSTGKISENEFGTFADEVMNAEWQPPLPSLPALQLGLQEVEHRSRYDIRQADAEAFMRQVYLAQQ